MKSPVIFLSFLVWLFFILTMFSFLFPIYVIIKPISENFTYHQLVEGKSVSRYPWATPQFYTKYILHAFIYFSL